MNTTILASTVWLTLLLAVGLFFFIRASVKERIQQVKLASPETEESLLNQLKQYFYQRAYQVVAVDAATNQVTFQGLVRPSWFMAIFLTVLAACGILCLSLVLSILFPTLTKVFLGLVALGPVAGVFYWKKAERLEQVSLKLESASTQAPGDQGAAEQCLVIVTGHRDELIQLQQSLKLKPLS